MNGNNGPKEVKQTPNEQQENQQPAIQNVNQLIAASHDKIEQCLGELASLINCDHAGLKGEHAAIVEYVQEIKLRLDRVEISNQAMGDVLARYVIIAPEPKPQPEIVEPDPERTTGEKPESGQKSESGI